MINGESMQTRSALGRTYAFPTREDVRLQDGSALTAKATLDRRLFLAFPEIMSRGLNHGGSDGSCA
jgi:hypothetical protein